MVRGKRVLVSPKCGQKWESRNFIQYFYDFHNPAFLLSCIKSRSSS